MPEAAALIRVEVVFAQPQRAHRFCLCVAPGASVGDAIRACVPLASIDALPAGPLEVGIFGRRCRLEDPVQDGDRVEIYRPLAVDPKTARRRRAARQGR